MSLRDEGFGRFYDFPQKRLWQLRGFSLYSNSYGVVGYRDYGHSRVLAGDPVLSARASYSEFFKGLRADCFDQALFGYYFSKDCAEGFGGSLIRCGESYGVDLRQFRLCGAQRRDLRRAERHFSSMQLETVEWKTEGVDSKVSRQLMKSYQQWVETKPLPKMGFLLGTPQLESQLERTFYAVDGCGEVQGFLTLVGDGLGRHYYLDQMVRSKGANKFVVEGLLLRVIETLKEEGAEGLSLGLCPFQGLEGADADGLEWGLWLMGQMSFLYNSRGLRHFKSKFSTHRSVRYMILDSRFARVPQIFNLTRATLDQGSYAK